MKWLLFVLLFPLLLPAQVLRRPVAAPYTGSGAYSVRHTDAFSFTANEAALAQLKNNAVGLYGERRFMLKELNHYAAVIALKTNSGNIGIRTDYTGYPDFNESRSGLAYGRKLGSKLDIGAQFHYHTIHVGGDGGSAAAIGFETGLIFHVNERVHTGLQVSNPVGGKFGKNREEKMASLYTFGIGYDASEKLLVSLSVEKEEDQPANVNAGIQYKMISLLMLRAGIASATSSAWAGAGLQLKSFRLDITVSVHPQLGITPGLLLLFPFSHKKE